MGLGEVELLLQYAVVRAFLLLVVVEVEPSRLLVML
jgi:hypothetical protein